MVALGITRHLPSSVIPPMPEQPMADLNGTTFGRAIFCRYMCLPSNCLPPNLPQKARGDETLPHTYLWAKTSPLFLHICNAIQHYAHYYPKITGVGQRPTKKKDSSQNPFLLHSYTIIITQTTIKIVLSGYYKQVFDLQLKLSLFLNHQS